MAAKRSKQSEYDYARCIKELRNGTLQNVYLFYGEENYLIQHLLNSLISLALNPESKELDMGKIDAQNKPSSLNFSKLADELRTPAFLSPRRVLLIQNSGLFTPSGANYAESAMRLLEASNDYAVLVFVEEKVDKRSKKFLQALQKYGAAVECKAEELNTLMAWCRQYLARYEINMTPAAAESLTERCGRSMLMLKNELDKLSLACRGEGRHEIDEAYIDAVCISDIRGTIFQLTDAAAAGNAEETFRLYHNLLEQKSAPQYILFMLARHFRQLLTAQSSPDIGYLMKALNTGRFVANKLWRQRGRFTPRQARYLYLLCAESDRKIKSGQNDEQSAVELVLLQALRPPVD